MPKIKFSCLHIIIEGHNFLNHILLSNSINFLLINFSRFRFILVKFDLLLFYFFLFGLFRSIFVKKSVYFGRIRSIFGQIWSLPANIGLFRSIVVYLIYNFDLFFYSPEMRKVLDIDRRDHILPFAATTDPVQPYSSNITYSCSHNRIGPTLHDIQVLFRLSCFVGHFVHNIFLFKWILLFNWIYPSTQCAAVIAQFSLSSAAPHLCRNVAKQYISYSQGFV